MTDRELLERAAKAAGHEWRGFSANGEPLLLRLAGSNISKPIIWNPLTDDGDALRLAVKLEMDVFVRGGRWTEAVRPMCPAVKEPHNGDPCAATRRAIVRAAAEVGSRWVA